MYSYDPASHAITLAHGDTATQQWDVSAAGLGAGDTVLFAVRRAGFGATPALEREMTPTDGIITLDISIEDSARLLAGEYAWNLCIRTSTGRYTQLLGSRMTILGVAHRV